MNSRNALVLAATFSAAWICDVTFAQYSPPDPPPRATHSDWETARDRDRTSTDRSADRRTDRSMDQSFDRTMSGDLHRASQLIGKNVQDFRGQNLGEIDNLAIDATHGRVTHAILSFNGRLYPVPWEALHVRRADRDRQEIRVDFDRQTLAAAPTIRRNELARLGDQQVQQRLHQHFRTESMQMRQRDADDTYFYDRPMRDSRDWRYDDRSIPQDRFDDDQFDDDADRLREWRYPDDDRYRRDTSFRDPDAGRSVDDPYMRTDDLYEDRLQRNRIKRDGWRDAYWDADAEFQSDRTTDDSPRWYGGWTRPSEPRAARTGDDRNLAIRDRDAQVIQRDSRMHSRIAATQIVNAETLLETNIESARDDRLGKVDDLIINSDTGEVEFIVLSTGGFLGMGQRLYAIPFQAADIRRTDRDRHQIVVNLDRDRLRQAPSFARNEYATFLADSRRTADVYAFHGVPMRDRGLAQDRDRERVLAFEPPTGEPRRTGMTMDPQTVMRNWPESSQRAASELLRRYGSPNGVTEDVMYWLDNGQWAHTIVYRDQVPNDFPVAHLDVVENAVFFRVPEDRIEDLARFSGSLIVYRTGGVLAHRSINEAMNTLALNLAHDIINDRRSVEEAREFFAQNARQLQRGEMTQYAQQLQFRSQSPSQAGNPGRPFEDSGDRFDRDDRGFNPR